MNENPQENKIYGEKIRLKIKGRLEARGWKETTVQEFLNLSDAEMTAIEKRIESERNQKDGR